MCYQFISVSKLFLGTNSDVDTCRNYNISSSWLLQIHNHDIVLNKIIYDLEYIDIAHTTKNLILQGKYSSKPSVESEI